MSPNMSAAEMVARVRAGAAKGLNLAAEHVLGVAVPLTPMETGDLRSSLTVVDAEPDDLESAVVSDLPYAARQHEDLDYHHEHGEAKFLETATHDSIREVEALIATAVRRELEG